MSRPTESKEKEAKPAELEKPDVAAGDNPGETEGASEERYKSFLHGLKEKLEEAAQKGIEVLKVGSDKATHFANEATHLARLKLDLRSLKEERNRVFRRIGEEVWKAHQENRLAKLKGLFTEELRNLDSLKEKIEAIEKEIEKISLVE